MEFKLLTRDQFREGTFERDGHKCVNCGNPAKDAHHILERRLWPDGGYYLENGASVCEPCHILCEQTIISVEEIREKAGITKAPVPPHLYPDHIYDKWGNHVLANGRRIRGELFFDESVQKILGQGGVLDLFLPYVKYQRTFHMPWSPGIHDDDKALPDMSKYVGKRVVVTEKLDGENTSMYSDYIHARSIDSGSHPSRSWVKNLWSQISMDIPEGWRVVAENVYAVHSIRYNNLESFVYGLSVWNEVNVCLSWDETKEWLELLGLKHPRVLYDGIYDEVAIRKLYDEKTMWDKSEGYVLRIADSFPYGAFKDSVCKYVRSHHVQTNKHWMRGQPIEVNGLAQDEETTA